MKNSGHPNLQQNRYEPIAIGNVARMNSPKVLLINPPNISIGSRMAAGDHLPPLGLLSIAGVLQMLHIKVELLDADFDNWPLPVIISEAKAKNPDFVLIGHSGSTTSQPIIEEILFHIKLELPNCTTMLGGVFPTYHWQAIMEKCPQIDLIVLGEGEQIVHDYFQYYLNGEDVYQTKGIVYRVQNVAVKNQDMPLIQDLEKFNIAWNLMEDTYYTYWGRRKAVVVQFSRGCPYPCNYCGQSLFWKKWRHRDPQKFADEIEMLHIKYGIEVFNFADENPATNKKAWKEFLEALIAKNLNLTLVGSLRTDNIVRDADILHLYRKAGFERFLLGIENYQPEVLKQIKKKASPTVDMQAIALLRQHNIISMATYVVGFGEEKLKDLFYSYKQLLHYDPDQIQILYATPHHWTPYYLEVKHRKVIQHDKRKWDYKHQVMETKHISAFTLFICVKLLEIGMQLRPKALYRNYLHPDKMFRKGMQWYTRVGRGVWIKEILQFIFTEKRINSNVTVEDFWTNPSENHLYSRNAIGELNLKTSAEF